MLLRAARKQIYVDVCMCCYNIKWNSYFCNAGERGHANFKCVLIQTLILGRQKRQYFVKITYITHKDKYNRWGVEWYHISKPYGHQRQQFFPRDDNKHWVAEYLWSCAVSCRAGSLHLQNLDKVSMYLKWVYIWKFWMGTSLCERNVKN